MEIYQRKEPSASANLGFNHNKMGFLLYPVRPKILVESGSLLF